MLRSAHRSACVRSRIVIARSTGHGNGFSFVAEAGHGYSGDAIRLDLATGATPRMLDRGGSAAH